MSLRVDLDVLIEAFHTGLSEADHAQALEALAECKALLARNANLLSALERVCLEPAKRAALSAGMLYMTQGVAAVVAEFKRALAR